MMEDRRHNRDILVLLFVIVFLLIFINIFASVYLYIEWIKRSDDIKNKVSSIQSFLDNKEIVICNNQ